MTREFFKVNKIVINCNIIAKPQKLGSYTTRCMRKDMRKVYFQWLKNVYVKSRKLMQYMSFETKIWMNNKVFPKSIVNKMHGNQFPVMGVLVI